MNEQGERPEGTPAASADGGSPAPPPSDRGELPAAADPGRPAGEAGRPGGPPDPAAGTGGGVRRADGTEPGDRPDPAARMEELESLLARAEEEKDRVLRAYADADNDRKRAIRAREDAARYGAAGLARSLLGAVDSLERALAAAPAKGSGPVKALREGIELTLQEVLAAFRSNGVDRVVPGPGDAFDPARHQAVQRIERDDLPDGSVAEVLQHGYVLRDRLLRAVSVVVAKAPEKSAAEDPAPGKRKAAAAAEDSGAGGE